MSSPSDILSRALADRFREVSNPVNIGRDILTTLRQLVRAANKALEFGDGVGPYHLVMDIEEIGYRSPLRPQPDSLVFFLSLHDTRVNGLSKMPHEIPEPSLLLCFHKNGVAECITTKELIVDEHVKKIKISRYESLKAHNQNGIETFVASWFRKNLDSKTMVAMQDAIDDQQRDEASVWSQDQINRLNSYRRRNEL